MKQHGFPRVLLKTSSIEHTDHPSSNLRVPGLTFSEKPYFQDLILPLAKWGQNVLLLGQSNAGKSYFLKRLLSIVKPKRLVVISNTSANQYRQDGMDLKHYSTMPESIVNIVCLIYKRVMLRLALGVFATNWPRLEDRKA